VISQCKANGQRPSLGSARIRGQIQIHNFRNVACRRHKRCPCRPTGSSAFPIGSSKQITTFSPQPKGSGKASLKYGKSENRRGVSNLTGLLPAQEDFTADAIDLGFAPLFLGCFYRRHRFANAAVRIVELAEFRIGPR
jgi:hypothetical protein